MNKLDIRALLQKYFGYDEFRLGQRELIEQLLSGGDCLGIMPTGAGKSLCYQLPALALNGLTLVISPLISLMHDQVGALLDAGISAAYLNSSLTPAQRSEVLRQAASGNYQLLYIAPERLDAADFIEFARSARIALIAIDEAHCISHWGQDFRPSYLRIPQFINSLAPRPPVGAFTATATKNVKTDIAELLHLREPLALTTGFDRPNLHFAVSRPKDKLEHLLAFLHERKQASGIIYCSTRNAVEDVCQELADAGFAATRYHAGLPEYERKANQDDFLYDRKTIMVATNAFGMGIDKSNVSYVVHYNMPKNLESYYQEAGRAGRDGSDATCLLLYAPKDVQTNKFLITLSDDSSQLDSQTRQELQLKDLELLKQMTFYATSNDCLRAFILDYFGEPTAPYCGNCSNCLTTFEETDATIEAQKIISCVYRLNQQNHSFGKSMIVDILRGSKNKRILQMRLDELSTYSIMADVPAKRIYSILDALISTKHLHTSSGEYSVVQLSNTFRELLAPDAKYLIKLPKEVERKAKDGQGGADRLHKKAKATSAFTDQSDIELFEALRTLRFKLAKDSDIPAYIIFSDATLRDMTIKRPTTPQTFLEVSGVGAKKLEAYGQAFLDRIAKHFENTG